MRRGTARDRRCWQRWIEAADGPPGKIYSITAKGRKAWDKARGEFTQTLGALKALGVEATEGLAPLSPTADYNPLSSVTAAWGMDGT